MAIDHATQRARRPNPPGNDMLQSRNCAPDAADTTGCPVCGQPVSCGARDGAAQCWCFDAPHLPAHARLDTGRCLCPACLRAALAEAGAGGG